MSDTVHLFSELLILFSMCIIGDHNLAMKLHLVLRSASNTVALQVWKFVGVAGVP